MMIVGGIMIYGILIKEAREALGLFQRDLANENLSRNLLSNIEMNRVRLLPTKALYLYKRIIEIAWSKDIYYTLDFDDILLDNEAYMLLKKANSFCFKLKQMKEGLCQLDLDEVLIALDFAAKNDVGYIRYHIYKYASGLLEGLVSNQYLLKIQFDTLDYLRWLKPTEIFEYYDYTLKTTTDLAYKLGEFEALIQYYDVYLEFRKLLDLEIDPKAVYNLSLFNQKIKKYDQALFYIDEYLRHGLNEVDHHDGLILKAVVLTSSDRVMEGLQIYEDLISVLGIEAAYERSLCLSNSIYVITSRRIQEKEGQLPFLIQALIDLLDKRDSKLCRHSLFSNIGLGYSFINEEEKAIEYFMKSFESVKDDDGFIKLITLMRESYQSFRKLGALDYIIEKILTIPVKEVASKCQNDYLKLLILVQKDIYCNDLLDDYSEFCNYISVNFGEVI